ncbi:hypothetical protein PTSG_03672 [Salpingoeca rosetta]|uniref:PX domain-containing protein n=1 Tax=Salpingoeca rosetta (strain ATCC 50818 / BSB-021) TaxID=946362 RepID=F2U693_SALR5|nr:uncharacterized protein PTSG_03672 [Salpingoeca rosetta]EGD83034.1 hypothetical protein PTSG_03672 [Salpingoeca rosetta]|eukprot:XP_004995398.1 hypothetical protein PTSG_03672 [Salpingoeca rosetta]
MHRRPYGTRHPSFPHRCCQVDRRYSHCRWLQQRLRTGAPFPPPLTRRNLESLQEHEQQLQGIKRFLSCVANNPKYQQTFALQEFFKPNIPLATWDWMTRLVSPAADEQGSTINATTTTVTNPTATATAGVRAGRLSSSSTLGSQDAAPHVFSPASTPSKSTHRSPSKAPSGYADDTSTDGSYRTVYDNYKRTPSLGSSHPGDISTEEPYHSEGPYAYTHSSSNLQRRPRHHRHRHDRNHPRRHRRHGRARLSRSLHDEQTAHTRTAASSSSAMIPQHHAHASALSKSTAARVVRPRTPPLEQPDIQDQQSPRPDNRRPRSGAVVNNDTTGDAVTEVDRAQAGHAHEHRAVDRSHRHTIRRPQHNHGSGVGSGGGTEGDGNDDGDDGDDEAITGGHTTPNARTAHANKHEGVVQWWIPLSPPVVEEAAHTPPSPHDHHRQRQPHQQRHQPRGTTWTIPVSPLGTTPQAAFKQQGQRQEHRDHQRQYDRQWQSRQRGQREQPTWRGDATSLEFRARGTDQHRHQHPRVMQPTATSSTMAEASQRRNAGCMDDAGGGGGVGPNLSVSSQPVRWMPLDASRIDSSMQP